MIALASLELDNIDPLDQFWAARHVSRAFLDYIKNPISFDRGFDLTVLSLCDSK